MSDDQTLASARTSLAHTRTWLSLSACCLLIVRLAVLRPLWVGIVAIPLAAAIVGSALVLAGRPTHSLRTLSLQVAAVGVLAVAVLCIPPG